MIQRLKAMPLRTAFALGALSIFGFAPFDSYFAVWPAPAFTLAGLYLLWQEATPRQAALRGFAWGAGFFVGGVSWIYVSLSQFSGMAPPLAALATLLFCLYLALFPALAGYLYRRLASADFWRDGLLLATLWTLTEWLRGTLFTGFPWLAIGYTQTPPSPLAGYAPVVGVYGISLIVAFVAALISRLPATKSRIKPLLAIGLILLGGQFLRSMSWTTPVGKPVKVSLLQGNIPQDVKWDPRRLALSIDRYIDLAQQNPAALTVLPETSLPLFFNEVPREILRSLTQHGEAILGVAVATQDGGYTNGAVALSRQLETQAYAKRHLVPFGEYQPPGFAWFFRLARIPLSGFTPGAASQAPLTIGGQRIAANICYEDVFGEELLPGLSQATMLLNLSNTAWFGDSLAQPQHLQIARLRALETGRVMLRATNTGMTAMIVPNGELAGVLPPFRAGALLVDAQGYEGLTPYARWGNLLVLAVIGGIVASATLAARRRRQSL
jgi:apolipoprotein N-acyltransferase